ncbi:nitroreductase [Breznakia sp. PF5-3]|uniref:nitroreductase family protein n=1 Tax=unclassified Breznakia TaxID=2623764 RepID=UPI00240556F3|nr:MULTISPECIES: nitroreductase family protein [unclassified Breznakia]MDF9825426.1 nitroreductase [Breznakia sp. PM6-1]MDF9836304.1 nitroreductase [Breznakia sp. PF5-3]MDF9838924.1 nitroreductase [Breznakia sp. PFB2-8]MDF9860950.1 nitroreductase [Breznakia sp. PH5-24]
METLDAIVQRQSCRSYKENQIDEEQLTKLLYAANAAPVGMKRYENVKITVIQNKEILKDINDACEKVFQRGQNVTYDAPTLVLVSVKKPEDKANPSALCNAACMIENMAIAATDLGIGSVYLLGLTRVLIEDKEFCDKLLIPEDFIPASAIALGYPEATFAMREATLENYKIDYLR